MAQQEYPNVAYIRPEIVNLLPIYNRIRACLIGKEGMIGLGHAALPKPNADDDSEENNVRYKAYQTRAVFYAVAARTLQGMVGEIFSNDPKVIVPENMKPITRDINGDGVSLIQQCKKAVSMNLAYSRGGLLVDYPKMPEGKEAFTVADMEAYNIRPTIRLFSTFAIINWRTVTVGNMTKLSMVVLAEPYIFQDDGFEMKSSQQLRVLYLDGDGNYNVQIWRPEDPKIVPDPDNILKGDKVPYQKYMVKDANGKPLKEIPFEFFGVTNNDSNPDNPALGDLCELNIAHFRNSADYEESCFISGQPTLWVSGITKEFVKDVWGGSTKVRFGAAGGIPVPKQGSIGVVKADSNIMPMEGMKHKEDQMVALGAKLIEDKNSKRTLGEAEMERSKETSILTNAAANVKDAYNRALAWCQKFSPSYGGTIEFDFTGDFYLSALSTEERAQLLREWQMGGITFEEYRTKLQKAGIAVETDINKARQDIANDMAVVPNNGANDNG